jgi:hypothetical protein
MPKRKYRPFSSYARPGRKAERQVMSCFSSLLGKVIGLFIVLLIVLALCGMCTGDTTEIETEGSAGLPTAAPFADVSVSVVKVYTEPR